MSRLSVWQHCHLYMDMRWLFCFSRYIRTGGEIIHATVVKWNQTRTEANTVVLVPSLTFIYNVVEVHKSKILYKTHKRRVLLPEVVP